jgi:hypothetical protein
VIPCRALRRIARISATRDLRMSSNRLMPNQLHSFHQRAIGCCLSLLALGLLGVLAVSAQAQPPPEPLPSRPVIPELPAASRAAPSVIPADLLPASAAQPGATTSRPPVPTVPEIDAGFAPKPLSPEMDNHRRHIEWRKLRNRVQNEADVRQALIRAQTAPTDLEKRKRLRGYYELLYARMAAGATADMKAFLQQRKSEALVTLPQPRVRPETLRLTGANPTPAPAAAPQRE